MIRDSISTVSLPLQDSRIDKGGGVNVVKLEIEPFLLDKIASSVAMCTVKKGHHDGAQCHHGGILISFAIKLIIKALNRTVFLLLLLFMYHTAGFQI